MKNPFELEPLFVAAVIGAIVYVALNHSSEQSTTPDWTAVRNGSLIGVLVQMGVRVVGVS